MLDQSGPGTVYRIWVTLFDPTSWLWVYFDGEVYTADQPVDAGPVLRDAGTVPVPAGRRQHPLQRRVHLFLPLAYQRSIRITTNMSGYYNIGYTPSAPHHGQHLDRHRGQRRSTHGLAQRRHRPSRRTCRI